MDEVLNKKFVIKEIIILDGVNGLESVPEYGD